MLLYILYRKRGIVESFSPKAKDIEALIIEIKNIVRARTNSMKIHHIKDENETIIRNWSLPWLNGEDMEWHED